MSKLTLREEFVILLDNEPIRRADAIVLLQGDGLHRAQQAVELFQGRWAPCILVSGGADNPAYGSLPGLADELMRRGISADSILREQQSRNTKEQADETMKLVKQRGWTRILLVASHYHQYRAFLTFLRAMMEAGLQIEIVNAPARTLPWFDKNPWGRRIDLLESEFEKIEKYQKEGDLATFQEAIEHQQWKQRQKA